MQTSFQLCYTTLFGWFATWVFIATNRPAVLSHMFCNLMGFPPFSAMAAHPHNVLLLLTTAAGIIGFLWCVWHDPCRHVHSVYA